MDDTNEYRDSARGVQAGEVDFALHTLGWKSFQDLCAEIAREVLGKTIQLFRPAQDGGRDAAFVGVSSSDAAPGQFEQSTIQCKFSSNPRKSLRLSDLKSEEASIVALVGQGLATSYVLMTNMSVAGPAAAAVTQWLTSLGVQSPMVLGRESLTFYLKSSARLRALVPRVYGLGDLAWIADEVRIRQARAVLQRLGDEGLKTYVPTEAHRKAVHALHKHGIALLIGEPASGKSTIAAILAANALDAEATDVIRVDRPEQFTSNWNVHEPKRFFWIDDAFGSNQIRRDFVDQWIREMPSLRTAISQGNRFVLTTRDYIWNEAQKELRLSALPALSEGEDGRVIINLEDLRIEEKEQILYNHIKYGDQSKDWRKRISDLLPDVAKHPRFLPEIARRLGQAAFTRRLVLGKTELGKFTASPKEFLIGTINELSEDGRAALALMFLYNGRLPSPIPQDERLDLVRQHYSAGLPRIRAALEHLKGSFVLHVVEDGAPIWVYKHPTIFDAYASIVARTPEAVEIFIRGAKLFDIFYQVRCGQITDAGEFVQVPSSLYPLLLERLSETPDQIEFNSGLFRFLADRVDRDFLSTALDALPDMTKREAMRYSPLRHSPKLRLLKRLAALSLGTSDDYQAGSSMLMQGLRWEGDATFLNDPDALKLFDPPALIALGYEICDSILSKFPEFIDDIHMNLGADDDVSDAFYELNRSISALRSHLPDGYFLESLTEAEGQIVSIIENWGGFDQLNDDGDLPSPSVPSAEQGQRSIFDDLHE